MDENTDVPSEEQLPTPDAADSNAGNGTDADFLPIDSTATESLISTSTDTTVSTDTLTATLTSTETITKSPTETSVSEPSITNVLAPADTFISSDALSVADALTSVDDLQSAEELTSASLKASADATAIANKVSSIDAVESSPVVCQLEEELKRLHEGDPLEDTKPPENVPIAEEGPPITKPVPEEKPLVTAKPIVEPVISEVSKVPNGKSVSKHPVEQGAAQDLDPLEMLASEEVSKNPILIKNAQEELKKIDVLVCGSCHEVFHFVEGFQAHKSGKCSGRSSLVPICEGEVKPQVWGFTLWKNRQNKLIKEGESVPSSWVIYQKWCKLPQSEKDAWIIAGQTLQFCSKIGSAKVSEFKPRPQLKQVEKVERDPLALDGFAESNKENSILANASPDNKTTASDVIKKTIVKPVKLNNDVTILPSTKNGNDNSNKALRTVRSTEKREYVVERIVAKRFNPKRKTWEYQIKWENFSSEENTWEPISNLNHCKQMVEEFEEQLKRLKAEKAKQQAAGLLPKGRGRPIKPSQSVSTPSSSSFSSDSTPGRPQRTSKQKALNQVKAWCGNISDADEGSVKRAFEDVDSDDSFEKKMKYEDYSDDSDVEIKPKMPLKKIAPKPPTVQVIKNGVGRVHPLPQNVLIPDANGVVRINQKQLPSLSTGVYIMSKTAGIIKLDSTTSKVATSGGQTIVKVAPKIGQTQIKIVKKDGATTTTKQIIQMTPNKSANVPAKIYKPVITKVRKPPEILPKPAPTRITIKPKEEVKKPEPPPIDDESDDGLEELPFPDDIQLPEPDSPPRDFVLDPITGKIAGQEYPDPEPAVVIKPDIEETSLENIVKLAAAEITEDDLKSEAVDSPMETDDIDTQEDEESPILKKTESNSSSTSSPVTTPVKVTMTSTLVRNEPSILNKALNSFTILRKSLTNSPPQPKVQQRILNRSVAHPRSHNAGSVMKSISHSPSLVRTRPMAPKPRFNIASNSSNIIKSQHDISPRNVYSKTNVPTVTRKIGNTTIRSTNSMAGHRPAARIVQTSTNVHKVSPRKESLLIRQVTERSVAPTKPKTVISMPSLIGDDEASLSPVPEVPKSPILPIATNVASMDTAEEATPVAEPEPSPEAAPLASAEASANSMTTDISSFTLADNENPIFITGDDGTVYQVAGQNEHGQTILLTQGTDGQQQCLLVTNEVAEAMETSPEESQADISMSEINASVTEPLSVKTENDSSDQVVAQVVRAEPPSPGGTHKVVVMLPDGNLMVTQVSPEEYASLELE